MNIPYRTRRVLRNIGIIVLTVIVTAVSAWLIWMLWLNRYVIYTRDGARLDFSRSSRELSGEEVKFTEPPEPISIYYNECSPTQDQCTDCLSFRKK